MLLNLNYDIEHCQLNPSEKWWVDQIEGEVFQS